jgi:phosphoribosylglycinamide formyltransferase 1
MRKKIVIIISGNGSNMIAIAQACHDRKWNADITAVISNKADAKGLIWAQQNKIPTCVVDHNQYATREKFDESLCKVVDKHQPDLIVLAGFMRILTNVFIDKFHDRLINIHPSLLPKYKGLNTHARAIENGDKIHGATVHYVTSELDSGSIILQDSVKIDIDDTAQTLAAKVLYIEHQLYPLAIEKIINNSIN